MHKSFLSAALILGFPTLAFANAPNAQPKLLQCEATITSFAKNTFGASQKFAARLSAESFRQPATPDSFIYSYRNQKAFTAGGGRFEIGIDARQPFTDSYLKFDSIAISVYDHLTGLASQSGGGFVGDEPGNNDRQALMFGSARALSGDLWQKPDGSKVDAKDDMLTVVCTLH